MNRGWAPRKTLRKKRTKRTKSPCFSSPSSSSSASMSGGRRNEAIYNTALRSRNAFAITLTLLKLIAAAASIGESRSPKNG